ncbi:MAG: hypothetical protein QXF15_01555 [Candidatus Aenigmatarchaeota archaeon]|nr:hypothetical protein [Candidatus Aenigmarchaeota archaeon]
MKGVTLLAMLLALLFLIGVTFITAGIIIYMYQISEIGGKKEITLTVHGINLPTLYQNVINLVLETNYTDENINIKFSELFTIASLQKVNCSNENNKIKINNKEITCEEIGKKLLNEINNWIKSKYILTWESPGGAIIIAENNPSQIFMKYKIYNVKYVFIPNIDYKLILYVIEPG